MFLVFSSPRGLLEDGGGLIVWRKKSFFSIGWLVSDEKSFLFFEIFVFLGGFREFFRDPSEKEEDQTA